MREDIRGRIIAVARHRGLITYGELMRDFHIARRKQIAGVLEDISHPDI